MKVVQTELVQNKCVISLNWTRKIGSEHTIPKQGISAKAAKAWHFISKYLICCLENVGRFPNGLEVYMPKLSEPIMCMPIPSPSLTPPQKLNLPVHFQEKRSSHK